MPIFIMNSETFLKKFIEKEDPKKVLRTQICIVSTTIRRTGRYSNIIQASFLYPNNRILADYLCDKDKDVFIDDYKHQLSEASRPFLATLINGAIEENYTIIFLCSHKESKFKYLDYLVEFVKEEFGYPIYKYEDYLKYGSSIFKRYDKEYVLKKVNKEFKIAKKEQKKKQLSTVNGRKEYIKNLSKSKMKKMVKDMNLYTKGMDKKELLDILELFFVNP